MENNNRIKEALRLKDSAKELYSKKKYLEACNQYGIAASMIELSKDDNNEIVTFANNENAETWQ